jgi:hypothetical protein
VPDLEHSAKQCFFKKGKTLSSAGPAALGKVMFFLKKEKTLPSAGPEALGKVKKIKIHFAECWTGTQQSNR